MCRRVRAFDRFHIKIEDSLVRRHDVEDVYLFEIIETRAKDEPSFSLTVAYRELARGHDCLLQRPVTLYSFLQKF